MQSVKRNVLVRRQVRLFRYGVEQRRAKRLRKAGRYPTATSIRLPDFKGNVRYFPSPEILDLSEHYEETTKFLLGFRHWSESNARHFYVDLRPLRKITPAAALVLASEFDRFKRLHKRRLRARDADEWYPPVRVLLRQMGFFSLLNVEGGGKDDDPSLKVQFLPFCSGDNADGKPVKDLRQLIESSAGSIGTKNKLLFFQAVSEAITNVKQHAYSEKLRERRAMQAYWMSASIDFESRTVTVMVLDHGMGIPRSLPKGALDPEKSRKSFAEALSSFLKISSLTGFDDDARLVEAAIVLGRSRTGDRFRGHGFSRDITWLVKNIAGNASLRIHSNRGLYRLTKAANADPEVTMKNFNRSLEGTFIEWRFEAPQLQLQLLA